MTDLDAREQIVLSLLGRWPWDLGGVILGGYAIIAYGPPRYSNDVDIVIPKEAALSVRTWLKTEGLQLTKHSIPNPQNFDGQVERYTSSAITLDLLTDAVRDRDARVDIPENWISKGGDMGETCNTLWADDYWSAHCPSGSSFGAQAPGWAASGHIGPLCNRRHTIRRGRSCFPVSRTDFKAAGHQVTFSSFHGQGSQDVCGLSEPTAVRRAERSGKHQKVGALCVHS